MKKFNFAILSIVAVALTACSSDEVIDTSVSQRVPTNKVIGFNVGTANLTRATTPRLPASSLESKGYYNFGVWAYKYTDIPSAAPEQTVMNHYLVGYSSGNDDSRVGYNYKYDSVNVSGTYAGSPNLDDNKSRWFYEGLGSTQYTGGEAGGTGANGKWMATSISTNTEQFLTYWDWAYNYTNFYAYTPYMASGVSLTINSDDGHATLQLPAGTLRAGMKNDDATKTFSSDDPLMYAGTRVSNTSMADVPLKFQHLGARIRLAFYENIAGYTVRLRNLSYQGNGLTKTWYGVQATPARKTAITDTTFSYSTENIAIKVGSDKVIFGANANHAALDTPKDSDMEDDNLVFPVSLTSDTLTITDRNLNPSADPTFLPQYYWAIPQDLNAQGVGFTFHVTFEIISISTGEIITVHNARVHVDKQYFNWENGYQYNYIFKIAHDTGGNTAPAHESEYLWPDPHDQDALKAIVFDGITVDEWTDHTHQEVIY